MAAISTKHNAKPLQNAALEPAEQPPESGRTVKLLSVGVVAFSVIAIVRLLQAEYNHELDRGTTAEHVFWHAWLTAVSTGFGVLPLVLGRLGSSSSKAGSSGRSINSGPVSSVAADKLAAMQALVAVAADDEGVDEDPWGPPPGRFSYWAREQLDIDHGTATTAQQQPGPDAADAQAPEPLPASSQRWAAVANAVACGMMTAASVALVVEAWSAVGHGGGHPAESAAGALAGHTGVSADAAVSAHSLGDTAGARPEVSLAADWTGAPPTPQLSLAANIGHAVVVAAQHSLASLHLGVSSLHSGHLAVALGLGLGLSFVTISKRYLDGHDHDQQELQLLQGLGLLTRADVDGNETAIGTATTADDDEAEAAVAAVASKTRGQGRANSSAISLPSQHSTRGHAGIQAATSLEAAKRSLLIVAVMFLHSAAEGIGLGVSFAPSSTSAGPGPGSSTGGYDGPSGHSAAVDNHGAGGSTAAAAGASGHAFGSLISLTLAVHNVPEGLATALVLLPRGVSPLHAALWAVFTSLPQPLLAVPAFLAAQAATALLPIGLGFAAGAMLHVAGLELWPECREGLGTAAAGAIAGLSAVGMGALQAVMR